MGLKHSGDYTGALSKFGEALAADPANADAMYGTAWILAEQGKKSEAKALFEKYLAAGTDDSKKSEAKAAIGRL
jgi:thioredoxin-like negative regulator of GroEL